MRKPALLFVAAVLGGCPALEPPPGDGSGRPLAPKGPGSVGGPGAGGGPAAGGGANAPSTPFDPAGSCYVPEVGYVPCGDDAPPAGDPDPTGGGAPGGGGTAPSVEPAGDSIVDTPPTPPPYDPPPGGNPPVNDPPVNDPPVYDPPVDEEPPVYDPPVVPVCAEEQFAGQAVPPRILLVVDKSGSMGQPAAGYSGSKWNAAKASINQVLASVGNDASFGLMLYPDGSGSSNVCREGALSVAPAPNTAATIATRLNNTSPAGGTPTADTLLRARTILDALPDDGGKRVAVLVTDGAPNCNYALNPNNCVCTAQGGCSGQARNCLDDANSVAAAQALNDAGYPVFVVGIPGAEGFLHVLDNLAVAGGTALPGARRYYDATSSVALAQALEQVTIRVIACRFDLAAPVYNPSTVSVRLGNNYVAEDPNHGWALVDPDTIELRGASCDIAAAAPTNVAINYCHLP